MDTSKWVTPFTKQCFVVLGASINMSQVGMVMGFAAAILPQLRAPTSTIPVDDDSSSWVASMPGFTFLLGNLAIPTLMAKLGRRKASIISIVIATLGWICLIGAKNLILILTGRFFQGVSLGMSSCLSPILIGEYASPKNRGAFSIAMSIIMAAGTFTVHAVGAYATWKTTALVCTVITMVDLIMVLMSPESPSWLAQQGKHEECKKVFRWLRGLEEEEELARMLEANKQAQAENGVDFKRKNNGFLSILVKKEFYKPVVIMIHLYTMGQWAGINILAPYIANLVDALVGREVDSAAVIISVDVQRMVSCVVAVYVIRKLRRRTMLFSIVGANVVVLLLISAYAFAKEHQMIAGHAAAGGLLIHMLMVTVAMGSLPLPFTVAGEIFPLRYRSLAGGISFVFCSINIFLPVKTFTRIERVVGLSGAFLLYAGVVAYCLVVVWFLLPETKDRTLQDIEEELKGKRSAEELKMAQPLKELTVE